MIISHENPVENTKKEQDLQKDMKIRLSSYQKYIRAIAVASFDEEVT